MKRDDLIELLKRLPEDDEVKINANGRWLDIVEVKRQNDYHPCIGIVLEEVVMTKEDAWHYGIRE